MKIYGLSNDFWWECLYQTYTDEEAEPLIRRGKIYSLGVKTGSFNTNTRLIITWHYHERIPLNFKKGDMQYLFADYFKKYEDEFLDIMRKRIGGNYNVLWKHYVFSDVNKHYSAPSNTQSSNKLGTGTSQSKQKIFKRLSDILVEQLGVEEDEISYNSKFVDDLGADSLDIVELIMAVEEGFYIEIPDEDAEKFKTVNDVVEYVNKNIM